MGLIPWVGLGFGYLRWDSWGRYEVNDITLFFGCVDSSRAMDELMGVPAGPCLTGRDP